MFRTILRVKKIIIAVPLLLAIALLTFFVYYSSGQKTPYPTTAAEVPVVVPSGQSELEIEECLASEEDYAMTECVKNLLMRNVSLGNYGLALGQLRYAADNNYIIAAGCHGYAHDMGLKAFEQGMPIIEIYKLGWNDCKMGFPHGAQIAASSTMNRSNIAEEFSALCDPLREFGERAVGECAHLTGHTIADLWLEDVSSGVKACSETGDNYFSFCVNGLIMRYAEIIDLAKISKDEESLRIVAAVWGDNFDSQLKTMTELCSQDLGPAAAPVCANSIPNLGAVLWRDPTTDLIDWKRIHLLCENFPQESPEREYCQKGIGASAISYITLPHELVLEACAAGGGYNNCVHTVANAIASHTPDGDPHELICRKVEKNAYDACLEGFSQGVEIARSLDG